MTLRKRCLLPFIACLFAVVSAGILAQTVQGVISGTITDPSGAVVAGATITITNTGTGISQSMKSGTAGEYRFPLVQPGTYDVQVQAVGFAKEKATGIVVQASQTVPFSVKLRVASSAELVEVTAQAPLIQTETSEQALQVDNTTIQNMALVDRDVFGTLPFLAPQAMPGMDTGVTAGGAREAGTAYLLNGGDDNDNFGEGVANVHPPLESVQDFSVLTNNMSAEYGRGMGAVVSASQKSGTNKFHGVVYEFNRNASLNANDFFYNRDLANDTTGTLTKRPKYIRNQYGGEVDGPILKDKTFFAGAYDRIKLLSGGTSANNFVPTSAAVAYLKANGGPLAQAVLAARPPVTSDTPCASLAGTGVSSGNQPSTEPNGLPNFVGCLSFFDPQTDTQDAYFGRVDQNFGSKNRLSFTANIYRELFDDKFGGGPLTTNGPVPGDTINHFHTLTLNDTHTFGSNVVNEATISHNRHYNVFQEGKGTKDTVPNIYIDNQNEGYVSYELGGDYEGGLVQNFTQDRWGLQDNLSWIVRKHSFKFGFGTQYGILYRNWDLGLPGQYEFGELITTTSTGSVVTPSSDGTLQPDGTITNVSDETLTNFAGDYPYFQETSIDPRTGAQANAYRHYIYHDYYTFVQDDWKLTPRLTLNLGLRWDRYGAPAEAHNIIAQFGSDFYSCSILDPACIATRVTQPVTRMWPTQNHDFGPRLGFAWDVLGDHKTALRGGFGINYDRIFDNEWSNGAWNPPFYALVDFAADGGDPIYYSNPGSIGAAYNPNGPCGQIPNPPSAGCTAHRVSVRAMDPHLKDSSGQNFYLSLEREVKGNVAVHASYQAELGRHLGMLQNLNRFDGDAANSKLSVKRPNPLYTGFNFRSNSVSSSYHALILQAQKRMSHGLQFDASYTFSKLLDVNSELFAGCSALATTTAYYYTTNKNPRLEYGRGSYDHRHSFKVDSVYKMPFFQSEKGVIGHVLGGWNVGGFFQFYQGHPIDVYDGRTRIRARDASGNLVLDPSGIPYNIGGDYNLDGVNNDRPNFIGHSLKNVYSHATPANGIFKDNSTIGSCASWVPGNVANCSPGNSLFETPPYPGSAPYYERFGTMGRDVLIGPSFGQLDLSLNKSFKLTERSQLEIRGQAQNLANHPNFDNVPGNLGDSTFGQAQSLVPFGLGEPKSRVMSVGARLAF